MSRWQCRPTTWQALFIAATLLFSYSYFPDFSGGWNQNSRLGLTRSIAENHSLYIEGYDRNTGDRAFWKGHYYSDKAPGLALIAVPVWEAARLAIRTAQKDPSGPRAIEAERYLSAVLCVGLPSALAAAALFIVALNLGASAWGAGFAAVALGLTTPLWCYAILFWGHALSASCLFFAFVAVPPLREFHSASRDLLLGFFIGIAAGWATVSEFPAAPASAILVLLALAYAWPGGPQRLCRVMAGVAAGALPCLLVLVAYNALAFGSPFKLGYSLSAQQGWPAMKQGLMGVTYPKMYVLREILVGRYRGLLPLAPVLVFAPFGLQLLWKQAHARGAAIVAAAIPIYYVLLNASYASWDGGRSYGPRHLSPALPFLCLPLALLWSRSSLFLRSLLAALAAYGVFVTLIAVSAGSMPPLNFRSPVKNLLWPAFRAGHLLPNLGTLAGLQGLPSLIPLFLVWAAAFAVWAVLQARRTSIGSELPHPEGPELALEKS